MESPAASDRKQQQQPPALVKASHYLHIIGDDSAFRNMIHEQLVEEKFPQESDLIKLTWRYDPWQKRYWTLTNIDNTYLKILTIKLLHKISLSLKEQSQQQAIQFEITQHILWSRIKPSPVAS